MQIDGLHKVLFLVFWTSSVVTGVIVGQTENLAVAIASGFFAGVVLTGVVTMAYISFLELLPVAWQRPYYRHFKKSILAKARKCELHPFVDNIVADYIERESDRDFEEGGLRNVKQKIEQVFEDVVTSPEFALVMADEVAQRGITTAIIIVRGNFPLIGEQKSSDKDAPTE